MDARRICIVAIYKASALHYLSEHSQQTALCSDNQIPFLREILVKYLIGYVKLSVDSPLPYFPVTLKKGSRT